MSRESSSKGIGIGDDSILIFMVLKLTNTSIGVGGDHSFLCGYQLYF